MSGALQTFPFRSDRFVVVDARPATRFPTRGRVAFAEVLDSISSASIGPASCSASSPPRPRAGPAPAAARPAPQLRCHLPAGGGRRRRPASSPVAQLLGAGGIGEQGQRCQDKGGGRTAGDLNCQLHPPSRSPPRVQDLSRCVISARTRGGVHPSRTRLHASRPSASPAGATRCARTRRRRRLPGYSVFGLGLGQHHQLGAGLVERVDQGDEPARLVAPVGRQPGHVLQEHGVEALGERQVVLRPQRLAAQAGEAGAQQAAGGAGQVHACGPAPPASRRSPRRAVQHVAPQGVERPLGRRARSGENQMPRGAQPVQAVVGRPGDPHHLQPLLQHGR